MDRLESARLDPPPDPHRSEGGEAQRLGRSIQALLDDLKQMGRDHALLAVLEVQRAGLSLVKMMSAGLVAAVLLVTAWMALVGSAVAWAAGEGTPWWVGLVGAALANIVVAAILALWIRSKLPNLMFAATVRQLRREGVPERGDGP